MEGALARRVKSAYTKPGHPVAYSSPATVAKHFGIGRKKAKDLLEHLEGYTLHREYKQPKVYNPYYVHNRREQVQGDLIDISKLAANNEGVRFLLVLIDIMTKKAWVFPLKNKSARSVRAALESWLSALRTLPQKLTTDRGLEFTNRPVQQLLTSHGIEWQGAHGTLKAAVVERLNKSLQVLVYKHLTENETLTYLNVLPKLVRTYNRRPHRTLEGMTPTEADRPVNEGRLQQIFHARYAKIGQHRPRRLPLKVGDTVRVKTMAKKVSSSSRAYAEQFKGELYTIVRVNRTLPIPLYYLRSLDTDDYIDGGFYANELQRKRGNIYRIERVHRQRRRRGVLEYYVKWKHFGPRHNSWIPAADVRRVY